MQHSPPTIAGGTGLTTRDGDDMEIFVYREDSSEVEEGFTVEQLPELLKHDKAVIWVDMEAPSLDDDRVLLDVFHFHPLTVEDCRANRHHPKVEEFPDYIYFIVHAVRTDSSPDRFNTVELDGYLGRNYVVTYHHDKFPSIDKVKQSVRSSPVLCQRGATFLLHHLFAASCEQRNPGGDPGLETQRVAFKKDLFKAA